MRGAHRLGEELFLFLDAFEELERVPHATKGQTEEPAPVRDLLIFLFKKKRIRRDERKLARDKWRRLKLPHQLDRFHKRGQMDIK